MKATVGRVNPSGRLERATYLDHVRADVERTAVLVTSGPLDAAVESCPGWDLAKLANHMGDVHRWVIECVTTARRPTGADHEPPDRADAGALAAWLRDGAARMIDVLSTADESAPTWHPFPIERVVGIWPRRQAHENAVHRVDAETAVGARTPIDPVLASDGVDEYFELVLPRLVAREHTALPSGSIHVHCTDVDGEWIAELTDGGLVVRREHAKGDAAVRGPAEALLLRLWNRVGDGAAGIEIVGDRDVAAAWLALTGL
jgi:uncharacterized protein (TIGR03083 family)